MRRRIHLRAAALLILAGCTLPGRPRAEDPYVRLAGLYENGRYFELRDAVSSMKDYSSIEMEFFRGVVDEAFNRLDPAIVHLQACVSGGRARRPSHAFAREAWMILSEAHIRKGQYGRVAEIQRTILDRFGREFEPGERAVLLNQMALWSWLAAVPPQEVVIEEDTSIRMSERIFPVSIGGRAFLFGYDTGSSLSILYESAARELGLLVSRLATRIQTSTGGWIEGRAAVVPEMRLGSIVVRNAVFLVLPDVLFSAPHPNLGQRRRGMLGAAVLTGFGEFTETSDGRLIIPRNPPARPERNLCFSGYMPIVDVVYREVHIPFCLDTGASETYLYPPFLHRYGGEIKARSRPRKATLGGIGNSRPVMYHILSEFAFRAGGKDFALRSIPAHSRVTNSNTARFFGTLGLDLFSQCSRMTINVISMSFVLE
jgi:hypothetical protein